jgi:hypothetical protein
MRLPRIGRQLNRAITLLLLVAPALPAQHITGHIYRTGSRTAIEAAEVRAVGTDVSAESDSAGAFVLRDLPPGWHVVQVRKVGYIARSDTVNVRDDRTLTRDFFLTRLDQLDTIRTMASASKPRTAAMRAFEERRANATSGYFIDEEILRKNEEKSLAGMIIQRVSGLTPVNSSQFGTALASTRKSCTGTAFSGGSCVPCFVTVYLDGVLNYQSKPGADLRVYPPVNFDRLLVTEFSAVEFYPGSGTGPAQYNATGSGCGTLLLWSRER